MSGVQPQLDDRAATAASLRDILARVHGELIEQGLRAEDLQATISAIVARLSAPLPPEAQVQLQAADALAQRLTRLALAVRALEAEAPAAWTLPAARDPASDLGRALARLGPTAARAAEDHGDCDFF